MLLIGASGFSLGYSVHKLMHDNSKDDWATEKIIGSAVVGALLLIGGFYSLPSSVAAGQHLDGTRFSLILNRGSTLSPDAIPSTLGQLTIFSQHTAVSDETIAKIFEAAPSLKHLKVHAPGFTGSFLRTIPDQLESLIIGGPNLSDLEGLSRLEHLSYLATRIEGFDQAALSKLQLPSSLTTLILRAKGELYDLSPLVSLRLEKLAIAGHLETSAARQLAEMTTLTHLLTESASDAGREFLFASHSLTKLGLKNSQLAWERSSISMPWKSVKWSKVSTAA